ncbi:ATP-binding cassette domain-containing protein [Actinomadura luteofluorescens]|uniref:ATP-binding cassette domain-containing protein n=1 Tax=Actinomadura luteofluorescens TaxID=46163 RepID=UPI003D9258AA
MGSNSTLAVETSGLVRTFGETRAVNGVDLAVPTGIVHSLLGPNGAGKTTLLRILTTLLRPTEGTARVLGHDVVREADAVRSRVSVTGQSTSIDEDLTGRENLAMVGRLLGHRGAAARQRADDLVDAFELSEVADRPVKTCSGGERRRIDIAASIIVTPDLLFLDEPTTGLDPRARNQVWDIIRTLVAGGTTVLLTTQYLDEADRLSDRVAVLDHGKVIAEDAPGRLKSQIGTGALKLRLQDPGQRARAEEMLSRTLAVEPGADSDPHRLSVRVTDAQQAARAVTALADAGIALDDFSMAQSSLDDVFLALTGHPVTGDGQAEKAEAVDGAEAEAEAEAGDKQTAK